uniref:GerMN domain-containing protein n=1 Tax=candidate division CPR3 bacterium TaxID=2268181 RepID=A0A7C4M0L4_UNCC3
MSKNKKQKKSIKPLIALVSVLTITLLIVLFIYQEKKTVFFQENEIKNEKIKEEMEFPESMNIRVFQPKNGDSIGLPLKILGEARVFENQFVVRIKDSKGTIIKEQNIIPESGDMGEFNLFDKEINYNKPATAEGYIEFFSYSPKDGSEENKVIVPVKFSPVSNVLNLQVFFGNSEKNPNSQDCSKVYPILRRVAYTKSQQAEKAIEELVLGPTNDESEKGYFTSINMGVKLNKITIKSGTAYVDFDETLQSGVGGSCRVTAIRAQITETLKQFPNISKVEILIDGKTEDILQP